MMKSKYKVDKDLNVRDDGKLVCCCPSKHMAYKIKSALEMVGTINYCNNCKNQDGSCLSECEKCKISTLIRSNFQPKEKK